MAKKKYPDDMLVDLARSGLDEDDAKLMGLEYKDEEWVDENLNWPYAGYLIPYPDIDGNIAPYEEKKYRVRFIDQEPRGKDKITNRAGHPKYVQPAGSPPRAFFSKHIDWPPVIASKAPLIIVEGEKKAAKACKHGFNAIGIGGVDAFMSAGREWAMLPELVALGLDGVSVYICYDSDVMTKKEVRSALYKLTKQLILLGAKVFYAFLPDNGKDKTGLDDFLVEFGPDAFAKLLEESPQASHSAAFDILNERAGLVETLGDYWDFETHQLMPPNQAKLVLSRLATITTVTPGKTKDLPGTTKTVPAWDSWHTSAASRAMRAVVYEPGNHRLITENNDLNAWRPSTLVPKRGNIRLWLDLIDHVFTPEYASWFLQWLAYPLQHPGTKLLSAVFAFGEVQGTGKTFAVDPVMKFIYGKNWQKVSHKTLGSTFNSELVRKQFLLFDEIHVDHGNHGLSSTLKNLVTQTHMEVHEKFIRSYTIKDHSNIYATANRADALGLNGDDRRWFLIRAPDITMSEYKPLHEALHGANEDLPGPMSQAVYYYLLHKVDVSDFDPRGRALRTKHRDEVLDIGKDPFEEYAKAVAFTPHEVFGRGTPALMTAARLRMHFYTLYPKAAGGTDKRLSGLLNQYKVQLPMRRVSVTATSPKYTLYAILERDVWEKQSNKDWAMLHETILEKGKL